MSDTKYLNEEVVEKVKKAVAATSPNLTDEEIEQTAIMFASTAAAINVYMRDVPPPFSVFLGAQMFAQSLLPLYLEHGLVNPTAIVEFQNKIKSGEINMEEELSENKGKHKKKGHLGFDFSRRD